MRTLLSGGRRTSAPRCEAALSRGLTECRLSTLSGPRQPNHDDDLRCPCGVPNGFALLALRFTGVKAHGLRLAYVRRFNEMEQTFQAPPALLAPQPTGGGLTSGQRFALAMIRESREAMLQDQCPRKPEGLTSVGWY